MVACIDSRCPCRPWQISVMVLGYEYNCTCSPAALSPLAVTYILDSRLGHTLVTHSAVQSTIEVRAALVLSRTHLYLRTRFIAACTSTYCEPRVRYGLSKTSRTHGTAINHVSSVCAITVGPEAWRVGACCHRPKSATFAKKESTTPKFG